MLSIRSIIDILKADDLTDNDKAIKLLGEDNKECHRELSELSELSEIFMPPIS